MRSLQIMHNIYYTQSLRIMEQQHANWEMLKCRVPSILHGEGHLMDETFAWGARSEIQPQLDPEDRAV